MDERKQAEAAVRRLIDASELPEPDDVQYRDHNAVLIWHEPELAVAVDLQTTAALR